MVSFISHIYKLFKSEEEEQPIPKPSMERYRILRQINHGAFSKVYEGLDKVTKRVVAIKVMPKGGLKQKQIHTILREIKVHKSLSHGNIVQYFDFVETPENFCLVMEMMKGGELFERIEKVEQFTEKDARDIIFQAAQAVKYLHDNNVVHRDIKPENLVFSTDSLSPVKLCDFGLSKVISDGTMTPCGTVGYIAPEVVSEQRHSFSVDIWGLGCVLYSLLCGFPVFYDDSVPVLTQKVKKGIYDFPSPWWDNVSPSAIDLIKKCLTVDPSRRYNIYQFLNHPWMKGETIINLRPLASPALLKDNARKEIFDVTYDAQRKELERLAEEEEEEAIQPLKPIVLAGVGQSALLAKREKKKRNNCG